MDYPIRESIFCPVSAATGGSVLLAPAGGEPQFPTIVTVFRQFCYDLGERQTERVVDRAMPGPTIREEFARPVDETGDGRAIRLLILDQMRRNGDDLAVINTLVGRVEDRVDILDRKVDGLDRKIDGLDRKVDGLDRKVDLLDRKVDGLVKNLPGMIADTMREVLNERDRK